MTLRCGKNLMSPLLNWKPGSEQAHDNVLIFKDGCFLEC
jgi:hypothetical protein